MVGVLVHCQIEISADQFDVKQNQKLQSALSWPLAHILTFILHTHTLLEQTRSSFSLSFSPSSSPSFPPWLCFALNSPDGEGAVSACVVVCVCVHSWMHGYPWVCIFTFPAQYKKISDSTCKPGENRGNTGETKVQYLKWISKGPCEDNHVSSFISMSDHQHHLLHIKSDFRSQKRYLTSNPHVRNKSNLTAPLHLETGLLIYIETVLNSNREKEREGVYEGGRERERERATERASSHQKRLHRPQCKVQVPHGDYIPLK